MKEQKKQNKTLHELNYNDLKSYNGGGTGNIFTDITHALAWTVGWHAANGGDYITRAQR